MLSPSAVSSSSSPGMQSSELAPMPWRKAVEGPLGLAVGCVTRGAAPLRVGLTGTQTPLSTSPVQPAWEQLAPSAGTQ